MTDVGTNIICDRIASIEQDLTKLKTQFEETLQVISKLTDCVESLQAIVAQINKNTVQYAPLNRPGDRYQ